MRIFLAAPMTGWIDNRSAHTWKALKSFIKELMRTLTRKGHYVFSAHDLEEFGEKPRLENICTPFDFLEVRRADLLIAFPSRSGGVHTEIGWASTLNKPIILLVSGDESPLARGLNALTQMDTLLISKVFPDDIREREEVIRKVMKRVSGFSPIVGASHVAFVATAFGFGPTAKAVAIAQEYRRRCPNSIIDFFGAGIDYDFAMCSQKFDRVIRLDVDQPSAVDDLVQHCDLYDDVISIMNFRVAQKWNSKKTRLHIVDSLAWLWPTAPSGIENASHYFVQRYLVDEHRLSEWRQNLPVIPVGPICRQLPPENNMAIIDNRTLLVNFSGCANPLIDEAVYKEYAITLTRWIAIEAPCLYDKIIVCVQRRIAEDIRREVEFPCAAEVGHLSPNDFTRWLSSADCILTSPGITTTLELLVIGKRPSFLLAQNYSQALLNERNLKLYPDQLSMAFSLIGSEFAVPEGLPEEEGVRLVVKLIKLALRDKEDWLRLRIRKMLETSSESEPVSMGELGQKQIISVICEGKVNP